MKRQIETLMDHLSQETSDVEKSESWQKVKQIADSRSGFDEEEQMKARELMMAYNLENSRFVIDITSFERNSKSIENANEQFIGPLLSLYYGLVIFLLNEISVYRACLESPDRFLVNLVYVFTIISFAYCLSLWGSFAYRDFSIPRKFNIFVKRIWNWFDTVPGKWWGGAFKIVIGAGVFALIVCTMNFTSLPDWLTMIITSLAFLVIIGGMGLSRLFVCEVKGNYSYIHALGHMSVFILYAAIISFITSVSHAAEVFEYLPTLPAIRLLIITFVIINGIIFPFWLPYSRIRTEARKMQKAITAAFVGRQQAAEKFKQGYENFCMQHGEKAITRKTEIVTGHKPEEESTTAISLADYVRQYSDMKNPESITDFCKRHKINEQDFRIIRKQMLRLHK